MRNKKSKTKPDNRVNNVENKKTIVAVNSSNSNANVNSAHLDELSLVTQENRKLKRDLSRLAYQLRELKKKSLVSRANLVFNYRNYSPKILFVSNHLRVINLRYNESRSRTTSIIDHLNKFGCPDLYTKLGMSSLANGYESISVVYMLYSYFSFLIELYEEVRFNSDLTYVSELLKFFESGDMIYLKNHFSEFNDCINLSDVDKKIIDSYNKLRFKFVGSIDSFVLPTYDIFFNDKYYVIGKNISEDYDNFKLIFRDFRDPTLPIFHYNQLYKGYIYNTESVILGQDVYTEPKVMNGFTITSIRERNREISMNYYTSSNNIELKFIPSNTLLEGSFSLYLAIYDYDIDIDDYHDHISVESFCASFSDVKNENFNFNVNINPYYELDKFDSYLVLANINDEPLVYPSMMQVFIPGGQRKNVGSLSVVG